MDNKEWVLEFYSWSFRKTDNDKRPELIQYWKKLPMTPKTFEGVMQSWANRMSNPQYDPARWRIRNVQTEETIPCAILT